jgi:hypothetical protein
MITLGLPRAIQESLPEPVWQRCYVHQSQRESVSETIQLSNFPQMFVEPPEHFADNVRSHHTDIMSGLVEEMPLISLGAPRSRNTLAGKKTATSIDRR